VKPTGAVIELLTRHDGVLVDAFDHAGYTPLHVAAASADASAVAALCSSGARYDVQAANDGDDREKGTPIKATTLLQHTCSLHNSMTDTTAQQGSVDALDIPSTLDFQRSDAGLSLKKLRQDSSCRCFLCLCRGGLKLIEQDGASCSSASLWCDTSSHRCSNRRS
jgi:ankyrin repeat protein